MSNRPWDVADGSRHSTDSAAAIATAPGIRDDVLELVQTAISAAEHARR